MEEEECDGKEAYIMGHIFHKKKKKAKHKIKRQKNAPPKTHYSTETD